MSVPNPIIPMPASQATLRRKSSGASASTAEEEARELVVTEALWCQSTISESTIYLMTLRILLAATSLFHPILFFILHNDWPWNVNHRCFSQFAANYLYLEPMVLSAFIFQCFIGFRPHRKEETNTRFISFTGIVHRIKVNFGFLEILHFFLYFGGLLIIKFWVEASVVVLLSVCLLPLVKENLYIAKSHHLETYVDRLHVRWLCLMIFQIYVAVSCRRYEEVFHEDIGDDEIHKYTKNIKTKYNEYEEKHGFNPWSNPSGTFALIASMHAASVLTLFEAFVMTDLIIPRQIKLSVGYVSMHRSHTLGIIIIGLASVASTVAFA